MHREQVLVRPEGPKWRVHLAKHQDRSHRFDSKMDAIHYGRKLASWNIPSRLLIEQADGRVEEERLYGKLAG
jgi:hypothetical protein